MSDMCSGNGMGLKEEKKKKEGGRIASVVVGSEHFSIFFFTQAATRQSVWAEVAVNARLMHRKVG